ncbi:Extracellular Matrix protein PelD [hydrothermal vent metagenome]|uniref:Extracellular Matrix protein PelD n=1 Tax=hydrothermal vent metagenome TaxID=652676 RepID=A0A1W1BJZ6_9ZZZZ
MLLTSNQREKFFKYAYLETMAIIGSYIGVGYLINPKDILMLDSEFSFVTILLAIVTLFHGMSSGVFALVLLGTTMKLGYEEFNYMYFLRESVLMLIFGEFHYYWTRTIKQHAIEDKFTRQKLSELSKAFYMLKISHDQIEKSYVVKPMSIRNSILTIKEKFDIDNPEIFYQEFLMLLQKTLNIERAFLLSVEDEESMTMMAQTDKDEIFYKDDLIVQDAMIKKKPIYISSDDLYNGSRYLAAIPVVMEDRLIGLFIISKMPFMSFNKDNLISATILISYMFDELYKLRILNHIDDFLYRFQDNFRFEVYRLYNLNQKFKIESTILIFKSYDKVKTHMLHELVGSNLRSLDLMSYLTTENFDAVAILFPLADRSSVKGFVNRIYNNMHIDSSTLDIEQSSFSISELDTIKLYLECQ